jgi:hypothetical protein
MVVVAVVVVVIRMAAAATAMGSVWEANWEAKATRGYGTTALTVVS